MRWIGSGGWVEVDRLGEVDRLRLVQVVEVGSGRVLYWFLATSTVAIHSPVTNGQPI